MQRTTVFVSYCHADRVWLERLRVQLTPLEQQGRIQLWDDTKIQTGSLWREEISKALASAKVAVLLVSADFLASEFITQNELPPLLKAAKNQGAKILPVIVGHCLYTDTPELKEFQAHNDPNRPLVNMKRGNRELALVGVARAVMAALGEEESEERRERREPTAKPLESGQLPEAGSKPPTTRARPTPLPSTLRGPALQELTTQERIDEETLRSMQTVKVMKSTPHSILQKCVLDEELVVVKGTRADFCDIEALRYLVAGGRRPLPSTGLTWGPETMAIPRAIWVHDEHLWELQHFYGGRSLADILLEQQEPMTGRPLLEVMEAVVDVLAVLHDNGLVHSDINPGNILRLDGTSEFRLIDWSFCCRPLWSKTGVLTPGYTAPEQDEGRPIPASDWYSLAATCFALANGFTPEEQGAAAFEQGIKEIRLGTGEFRGWPEEEFFRALLNPDPAARPKPWEKKRIRFDVGRTSQPRHFDRE